MVHQIESIVSTISGCQFAFMDTITKVSLKGGKKNPMKDRVTKRASNQKVMIFSTNEGYENKVKRHLKKEGKDPESFEVQPRKWGTRRKDQPLVDHKGKVYIEVIFVSPGKIEYLLDGKEINKDDIIGLEPKKEAEQGGVDEKVIIRTYALDSIISLRANKQSYNVDE